MKICPMKNQRVISSISCVFFFSISDVTWMFDEVEEDEEVEGTLKSFAKMFRIKQI